LSPSADTPLEVEKLSFTVFSFNSTNSKAIKAGRKNWKTLETKEPATRLRYSTMSVRYVTIEKRYGISDPKITPKSVTKQVAFSALILFLFARTYNTAKNSANPPKLRNKLANVKTVWKSTALLKSEEFERAIRTANDKKINPIDNPKAATKAMIDFFTRFSTKLHFIANG
jgi:hypothetical protein